jgi:hypothetical protein
VCEGELEFVANLVDDTVPGKSSIVNNDMDLSVSKFSCLLYHSLQVCAVLNVTGNRDGSSRRSIVDGLGDGFGLSCWTSLAPYLQHCSYAVSELPRMLQMEV